MQKTFSVSVPAETRTLHPKKNGHAEVTITVANTKPHPARARVQLITKDGAKDEWFIVSGDAERDFAAAEAQQYKVSVHIPPDTPAGTYNFRVDAINVVNPQEDFTQGDTSSVQWELEPVTRKSPAIWIVPTIVAALLLIGSAATVPFLISRGDDPVDPENIIDDTAVPSDIIGKMRDEAETQLQEIGWTVEFVVDEKTPTLGYDPGAVTKSDPPPGERPGPSKTVTLHLNPLEVEVPNVAGGEWTVEKAREALNAAGLQCEAVEIAPPRRPFDRVVAMEPAAGQKVALGSTVKLKRAYEISVPGLKETRYDSSSLKEYPEFEVVVETKEQYDASKVGLVDSQLPAPGTPITCNGDRHKLTLVVLSTPSIVPVPDLRGYSKDKAQRELEKLGFKVSVADEYCYEAVESGHAPKPRFLQVVAISTKDKQKKSFYGNPRSAEAFPNALPFQSDITIHLSTVYDSKLTMGDLRFHSPTWADPSIRYVYLSFDYTAEIHCDEVQFVASGRVEDLGAESQTQAFRRKTASIDSKVLGDGFDCRIVVTLSNISYRFDKTGSKQRVAGKVKLTGTAAMSCNPWNLGASYQTGNIKEDREAAELFWRRNLNTQASVVFSASLSRDSTEVPSSR